MIRKILLLCAMSTSLFACGSRTHAEVCAQTIELAESSPVPNLHDFLNNRAEIFYSGAIFPDWAYGIIGGEYRFYSEIAHGEDFAEFFRESIFAEYHDFESDEFKDLYAFMLGICAHRVADDIFHGATGERSLLVESMLRDSISHDYAEGALDIVLAHETPRLSLDGRYFRTFAARVYQSMGETLVDSILVKRGTNMLDMGWNLVTNSSESNYITACGRIPWMSEVRDTFFPGGLDNLSRAVLTVIERVYAQDMGAMSLYRNAHFRTGYDGTTDCTIMREYPQNNFGAEQSLMLCNNREAILAKFLAKWNVGEIDYFDSAKVFLHAENVYFEAMETPVVVANMLLSAWVEGDGAGTDGLDTLGDFCSWQFAGANIPWSGAGISVDGFDFAAEPYFISRYDFTQQTFSFDVTSAVRAWATHTLFNEGLVFCIPVIGESAYVSISSAQSRQINLRPSLAIYAGEFVRIAESKTQLPQAASINAFPNPFNSSCFIDSPYGERLTIFDLSGKIVTELRENHRIWTPSSDVASGVYFVRAASADRYVAPKAIVFLR